MPFLVGGVLKLLHVEVGEDPNKRRAHIDATTQSYFGQTVEQAWYFHRT
jgi:hypothetical protein